MAVTYYQSFAFQLPMGRHFGPNQPFLAVHRPFFVHPACGVNQPFDLNHLKCLDPLDFFQIDLLLGFLGLALPLVYLIFLMFFLSPCRCRPVLFAGEAYLHGQDFQKKTPNKKEPLRHRETVTTDIA